MVCMWCASSPKVIGTSMVLNEASSHSILSSRSFSALRIVSSYVGPHEKKDAIFQIFQFDFLRSLWPILTNHSADQFQSNQKMSFQKFMASSPFRLRLTARISQKFNHQRIHQRISHQQRTSGTCRSFSAVPKSSAFSDLLDSKQKDHVTSTKAMLKNLHTQLIELGTPTEELQVIRDAISQMDSSFMVCVAGIS